MAPSWNLYERIRQSYEDFINDEATLAITRFENAMVELENDYDEDEDDDDERIVVIVNRRNCEQCLYCYRQASNRCLDRFIAATLRANIVNEELRSLRENITFWRESALIGRSSKSLLTIISLNFFS